MLQLFSCTEEAIYKHLPLTDSQTHIYIQNELQNPLWPPITKCSVFDFFAFGRMNMHNVPIHKH